MRERTSRVRAAALAAAHAATLATAAIVVGLVPGTAGCGGEDDGPTVTVDPDAPIPDSPAAPVCVFNHAYQENTEADSLETILASARGCYVLVDPFEADAGTQVAAIAALGNQVGCYVSVGTCEDWRDDFDALRPACATRQWGAWAGEYFVSDTAAALPPMKARFDAMAAWGCEWVEFDNMDWAEDDSAVARYDLQVDATSGAAYNRELCAHARSLGMRCMAKNTALGAEDFEGGTFESYPDDLDWWDRAALARHVDAGQLAVVVHYDERDCESVALWYRQRYGSGVSFLCEDPRVGGYVHAE